MLYSLVALDANNSLDDRLKYRAEHRARLAALQQQGRLVTAGANPATDNADPGVAGFTGSVIIAEFSSLEEAQQWANADPYLSAGVYDEVLVKPYIQIFSALIND